METLEESAMSQSVISKAKRWNFWRSSKQQDFRKISKSMDDTMMERILFPAGEYIS